MDDNNKKNEIIKRMSEVEYYPTIQEENYNLEKCTKLPLEKISALGVAFEPLTAAFQNIVFGKEATSGIVKYTIPKGGHLASFNDGSGKLGSVLNGNNQLMGQARLNPLVCDPTMLFMAAALANIEKKLDNILETQKEILGFLEQQDKSKLKGNLIYLTDILNNYKYNWNNEKYINSNHIKVLDIKQDAEQSILFHRDQIERKIKKGKLIHSDQDVKVMVIKFLSEFEDYQLALYLFAFSSFLDVMLLENFESAFLEHIEQKIDNYSFQYRELYTKCYNQIDDFSKSSIQTHLLKGLSKGSKAVGNAVSKVPVIGKSQIDETLIEAGNKLDEVGLKIKMNTFTQIVNKHNSNVRPFLENIKTINKLYNQPLELFYDQKSIYIS